MNLLSNIYELFYKSGDPNYSDTLFDNSGYLFLFLTAITVTIIVLLLFYKLIDSLKYSHIVHWIVVMVLNMLFVFIISYITVKSIVPDYGIEYIFSGVSNSIISLVFYILFSLGFKKISTNNHHNPF
jgi:hypothetical protein